MIHAVLRVIKIAIALFNVTLSEEIRVRTLAVRGAKRDRPLDEVR